MFECKKHTGTNRISIYIMLCANITQGILDMMHETLLEMVAINFIEEICKLSLFDMKRKRNFNNVIIVFCTSIIGSYNCYIVIYRIFYHMQENAFNKLIFIY